MPADSDGLETSPSPEIIAPHVLGELKFNDVVLPESARLGLSRNCFSQCPGNSVSISNICCWCCARHYGRGIRGSC